MQEWRADLVEARERQLHLRLDAGRTRDPAPGGPAEHVVQQGCLPDARGPTKDKRGARTLPGTGDQLVEGRAFVPPAVETVGRVILDGRHVHQPHQFGSGR